MHPINTQNGSKCEQSHELHQYDETKDNVSGNRNYDYFYYNKQQSNNNHTNSHRYEDEYDMNDYDEWNHYDECDYDPTTNKTTVITYTTDKKPKHKTNPSVQTRQNTMKIVNKINNYNQWKSHFKQTDNPYGVIVINGKQLCIGIICGGCKQHLLTEKNNFKSGKHRRGGQSAARFGRIYDNKINCFIKDCALKINEIFDNNRDITLNGILLSGNGTMKNKLYQSKFMKKDIANAIIKTVNTKYGGEKGFNEIFQRIQSKQLLDKSEMQNKSDIGIIEEIMEMVQNKDKCDLVSIGTDETIKAIKMKIIKYVLISETYYKYVIKKHSKPIKFVTNDMDLHETIDRMGISISNNNKTWKIVDFVQYMKNLCRINNVRLKMIGDNCENAKTFFRDFSGCVGILYQSFRYLEDNNEQ